jgi:predicted helicase
MSSGGVQVAGLAALLGRLSAEQHVRGRQFEELCRWFFTNDPLFTTQLKRVWLWRDWPGRWGPDAGIDLVAKTNAGELWAIQAKAYHPAHSITKRDVDTFLSESARPEFSHRLVIGTTNQIGATARRTIEAQRVSAGLLLLADLEKSQVEWPRSPGDLRPARVRRKRPFPHNRKAVREICHGFEKTDRGQLIMACGTGKTLVGLWAAERLGSRRTLVLLPSLSLLAQTMREWTANASSPFAVLAACSDQTVTAEDDLVEHTEELGIPVTTKAEDIATFLRQRGPRVVFASYQSSPRIADAFATPVPAFDLAIADEAHRCAGPLAGDFATILDPKAIRARRRLFMTATPRFFTERLRREGRDADWELASMDDKDLFGEVFHRLPFGEAIDRGLLADYQVAIIGVDDVTYRSYAERAALVRTDSLPSTDARTLAGQIGRVKP